jgi:hypothetical protein
LVGNLITKKFCKQKKKKRKLDDVGDDKESKKQSKDFKATKSCKKFADIGGNEKSLKVIICSI